MYREAPIRNGNFDYVEFTRILKHGKKDKDDDWWPTAGVDLRTCQRQFFHPT